MAFAIGTDIAHMAGKSIISTMRHGKFGNVDYKLGFIMLGGTLVGFEAGAQMVMWLEQIGEVDKVVRWIYLDLAAIAWMVFADVAKRRAKEKPRARPERPSTNLPPASNGTRPCIGSTFPP